MNKLFAIILIFGLAYFAWSYSEWTRITMVALISGFLGMLIHAIYEEEIKK